MRHNFIEADFKHWTTKYSGKVYDTIKNEGYNANTKVFSLEEFKELLGLDSNYSAKNISSNIFPNLKKVLTQNYKKFEILCIKENRAGFLVIFVKIKSKGFENLAMKGKIYYDYYSMVSWTYV